MTDIFFMGTPPDFNKESDFTITSLTLQGGFEILWQTKNAGFGGTVFFLKEGKVVIDNECMGKEFIKKLLCKMVDDAVLMDESRNGT